MVSLKNLIVERIKTKGPMSFREFMHTCLYTPTLGYYCRKEIPVGKKGDYYTSPCVHKAFGHLICKWLFSLWQSLDNPTTFNIIEYGAGRGHLAKDILDYASKLNLSFYHAIAYIISEFSHTRVEEQKKLFGGTPHQAKVSWFEPGDLKSMSSFANAVVSNEFVDSLPVHLCQFHDGLFEEIWVDWENHGFVEVLVPIKNIKLKQYLIHYVAKAEEGQRVEVNLDVLDWLKEVAYVLGKGSCLTIDYGYPAERLYDPHIRKEGSLVCYHKHMWTNNPYEKIGEQDITSHVNFTALMEEGNLLCLSTDFFASQAKFLVDSGLESYLQEFLAENGLEVYQREILTIKRLFCDAPGMGSSFKVLVQSKN